MSNLTSTQENDLRAKVATGDLAACDELATHLHAQRKYEDSAALYLKAVQGGFYKSNPIPQSEQNFFGMIEHKLIPATSDAVRYVQDRRQTQDKLKGRAHTAAGRAAIAAFIGYMVIVFGGGIPGILRDFSLLIAGGLAWGVWQLVLSSFNGDA